MVTRDDFLNVLDEWQDTMPDISNEAAYVLAEFIHALHLWVDSRYYPQMVAYLNEITPDKSHLKIPWDPCDEEANNDTSSFNNEKSL